MQTNSIQENANSFLSSLNPEQLEAVTTTEGYVRVIAGAGSGKTRALTYRFAYLVNQIGILPSHILCVTFTNKAAAEMRRRIRELTGDNDTGYISTFHGFCVSVLQEDSNAVSYPKSFLVLDNSDINAMLQIIYEERGLTLRQMTFSHARDMIEIRKIFKEPHYYEDLITMPLEQIHQKYLTATKPDDIIFYGYLYQEKKCFGLDYNDLLKFVLYIFQTNDEIRQKWQERLEYIMIDEFQDIDLIQYEVMKALCPYHNNLFVVGDPDQTIYTWRGADIRYLLEFDKNFPGVRTIMMNRNYRSTKPILDAANSLIGKNKGRIKKDLVVGNKGGGSLPLASTADAFSATPSPRGSAPKTPENSPRASEYARTTPPTDIPVYTLPRTYTSDDPRAWQARHWFKEDYCQGPGNILYVHADGNIAPCCGFANENPALFIGTIHDSFKTIMQKAATNPMIKICYEEGLSHYRRHGLKKSLRSQGKKLPGTTGDICTLCDFVCKTISY